MYVQIQTVHLRQHILSIYGHWSAHKIAVYNTQTNSIYSNGQQYDSHYSPNESLKFQIDLLLL